MKIYHIRINMKDGSKKYVSVGRYGRIGIVSTKTKNGAFLSEEMAQYVSDRFWESHWNRETMEIREVVSK